jgi:nondiscriminating aspartyl-tRNA synthetase
VTFVILRDVRGLAQVVVEDAELVATLAKLNAESVLEIEGLVVASSAAAGFELQQPDVRVLSAATAPPPFDLFRPNLNLQLPVLLDHAAVALRHPRQRALFELSAASLHGFRTTLDAQGFTEIQTPKIVASATEGGANVFEIDYFGKPAYLAQSPQFYKQAMVGVFERVYEIGPVFRAEPHDTMRHLSEYVSLDVEMGFIADHTTVMALLTDLLRGMMCAIRERAPEALRLREVALPEVPPVIPAIHFSEALERIYRDTGEDSRHEPDLAPHHERYLCEWAQREYGSEFLFVVGYPLAKRPFYTHPQPSDPTYSNSFDLLFRGLELVTGGQRLHAYDDYRTALRQRGLPEEPFRGYLEAFRHGMPPHGGFAIGLERWIARLAGVPNIRETALFPRDKERIAP